MIILGIILLLIGFIAKIAILWRSGSSSWLSAWSSSCWDPWDAPWAGGATITEVLAAGSLKPVRAT